MNLRQPNRVEPALPAGAMKTYQILAPISTHFRAATCAEVECDAYRLGWNSEIDESTPLGQAQAYYIRNQSGRRFTEDRNRAPGITVFMFEPGQQAFPSPKHEHRVPVGRPELFIVRGGDWRGNPTGEHRQHTRPEDWVDDFANHQGALAERIEKG